MLEKIKTHIEEHKTRYACIATGIVVAGFTCLVMKRGCGAVALGGTDGPVKVTVHPLAFFSKQENAVFTTIHRGGPGSPSYIVECIETGEAWLSQRQAATTKNIPEFKLSGHLNGKFTDVDGLHYRRLGVATA
ncbi:MAG: hypothetical protein ABWY25_09680 [Paenisporosarcina sp.]